MGKLEDAYRMLELEPGASMDEINQAYKDLVFVWHPDRLPTENVRLQDKAQEKIKYLNQARDYLRSQAKVGNPAVSARTSSTGASRSSYGERRERQAYASAHSTYRPRTATPPVEDRSGDRHNGYGNYYRSRQYYRPDTSQYRSYGESRSYGNNSTTSNSSTSTTGTTHGNGAASATNNGNYYQPRSAAAPDPAREPARPYTAGGNGNSYYRDTWSGGYPGPGSGYPQPQSSTGSAPSNSASPSSSYSRSRSQDPDLSDADLRGANFQERDFSGRNLSNANLSEANLQDAFLHKVNLNRANLCKANLFRANLLQANLSHANLREANLIGADLSGADLSGADLSGAKVAVGDKVMVKLTGTILTGAIMPDGTIYT
ncbi:MAG: pentapeptide repeat-containing protein [Cyanobacteria bacterium]|nr:pentapeptide repeat-containing protein [Cyanobacteriota bacterium]